MLLILSRAINQGGPAQALAMGPFVFRGAFLAACADDQDTQAPEAPSPTAAVAVASVDSQPTQGGDRAGVFPWMPGLHGDAGNGRQAVFGCTGGALAVEAHNGEYFHVFVAAPEGSPEDSA